VCKENKEPDPKEIEAIVNFQPPTDVKGHIGWYTDIMHDYVTTNSFD
jgi:hypothetical protein